MSFTERGKKKKHLKKKKKKSHKAKLKVRNPTGFFFLKHSQKNKNKKTGHSNELNLGKVFTLILLDLSSTRHISIQKKQTKTKMNIHAEKSG